MLNCFLERIKLKEEIAKLKKDEDRLMSIVDDADQRCLKLTVENAKLKDWQKRAVEWMIRNHCEDMYGEGFHSERMCSDCNERLQLLAEAESKKEGE